METTPEEQRYARELSAALTGMPDERRTAIVDDVRAHIADATARGRAVGEVLDALGPAADVAREAIAEAGYVQAGVRRMRPFDVAMLIVCLLAQVSSVPAMVRYLATMPGGQAALLTLIPVAGAALVVFVPLRRRTSTRLIVVIAATVIEIATMVFASLDLAQNPVARSVSKQPFIGPTMDVAGYLGAGLGILMVMGWTGVALSAWMRRPRSHVAGLAIRIVAGLVLGYWAVTGIVVSIQQIVSTRTYTGTIDAVDVWDLVSAVILTVLVIGFFTGRRVWFMLLAIYGAVLLLIAMVSAAPFAAVQGAIAVVYLTFGMAGWTAQSPRLVRVRSQAAAVE